MQKFADINEKIESSFARILEEREADPLDLCFHLMLLSSGPLIQLKGRS